MVICVFIWVWCGVEGFLPACGEVVGLVVRGEACVIGAWRWSVSLGCGDRAVPVHEVGLGVLVKVMLGDVVDFCQC